ncbi:MAG: type II toxin-antitoxin system RelE/ParE family toxin [Janthinobacterium lividum]
MSLCIFTLPARDDLKGIHDFIARDDVEAALRFVQRLEQRCKNIADMPGMGRRRDDLVPGLRSVVEGNYIIFYRLADDNIIIQRVLQGSQDLLSQFD